MFGIIWFIIVGIIIYKAVKKRSNEVSDAQQQNMPPMQQRQQANRMGNNMQPQNARQNMQRQTAQQDRQGSTMAYLEEKARQDAMEHAQDKLEESRRLYQNSGGRCVAERLYEGDSVPNGKRCVVCGYCGAENLVPMTARERYSCYFCREQIN